MTYCSTYIGDLDDPKFDITASGPVGNIPRALAKSFPPDAYHHNGSFHRWVEERKIQTFQTDYATFVARVTKSQLLDYIDFAYGSSPSYTDPECMLRAEGRPYLVDKLNAIKAVVEALSEDKLYALVAETD